MMHNGNVPFLDLVGVHAELESELTAVFREALRGAAFIGGPAVESFEAGFAAFCETDYCIGVNSGTDALRFALMAAGVKSGDIVVTVPNTFIATTEAITQAGARPDFVDIDERTYNMDATLLAEYLATECRRESPAGPMIHRKHGRPVTAVVPVHLYGQPADMDPILDLAARYGLLVVEDACQAHGAEYYSQREGRWRKAGSMGVAAAFSFYPGKNLGACGEGGAVTTNDAALARHVRMLRDHGQAKKYYHEMEGYNGRLDAIQAGILHVKLQRLARWNQARRNAAACYRALLAESHAEAIAPYEPDWTRPVYHLFVVRVEDRDALIRSLAQEGIGTGIHYPIPLHLQNAYKTLGYGPGAFPVSERVAGEIVSLPMFPGLTAAQQKRVVDAVARETLRPVPAARRAAGR